MFTEPSIEQPWYGVSFGDAIDRAFHKYFVFQGRASRGEFWWYYLATAIAGLVIGWVPLVGWLVSLAVNLPLLSLAWRRMHDIGKPGWWSLIPPAVGGLVMTVGVIVSIGLGRQNMWGEIEEPSWPLFFGSLIIGLACFAFGIYLLAKPTDPQPNQYDLPLGAPISGAFGNTQPSAPSGGYVLGTPAPMPFGTQGSGYAAPGSPSGSAYPSTPGFPAPAQPASAAQNPALPSGFPMGGQPYPAQPDFGTVNPSVAPDLAPAAPAAQAAQAAQPAQTAQAQPAAEAAPVDPVLAELANAATPQARLQEIAAMTPTHPEYKDALLAHPNLYPALRTWLEQL